MLVAVAILHCIVRRRRRQASSNWTSRRTLCVITPQSENGPEWEVYVLELSPASARDVEKALQKSSLGGSNSQHSQFSPFSAGPQPVPPAVLQSGTPTRLDTSESAPVCSSNAKVDAQSQGKNLTTSESTIYSDHSHSSN